MHTYIHTHTLVYISACILQGISQNIPTYTRHAHSMHHCISNTSQCMCSCIHRNVYVKAFQIMYQRIGVCINVLQGCTNTHMYIYIYIERERERERDREREREKERKRDIDIVAYTKGLIWVSLRSTRIRPFVNSTSRVKQKRTYVIYNYFSEPALVEMLDAVSLLLLHFIVS